MTVYRHRVECGPEWVGDFYFPERLHRIGDAYRLSVKGKQVDVTCVGEFEGVLCLKVTPEALVVVQLSDLFFPVEVEEVLPPYKENVLYYEQKLSGFYLIVEVVWVHHGGTAKADAVIELPGDVMTDAAFIEFRDAVIRAKEVAHKEITHLIKRRAKRC